MNGQSYRLKTPTLGMLTLDTSGHQIPITLPLNAVVRPESDSLEEDRLIEVIWQGTTLMMFAQDLRVRGEPVEG